MLYLLSCNWWSRRSSGEWTSANAINKKNNADKVLPETIRHKKAFYFLDNKLYFKTYETEIAHLEVIMIHSIILCQ